MVQAPPSGNPRGPFPRLIEVNASGPASLQDERISLFKPSESMISIDDIIGLSGLTQEEVDAIAEHEHVPEAAAAALGAYLLHERHGAETIARMISDDIRDALSKGNQRHARELFAALRHFTTEHLSDMR